MRLELKGIKIQEQDYRNHYVVSFAVSDDNITATFETTVPYIRSYYKKVMEKIPDIERDARGDVRAFLERLLTELSPKTGISKPAEVSREGLIEAGMIPVSGKAEEAAEP